MTALDDATYFQPAPMPEPPTYFQITLRTGDVWAKGAYAAANKVRPTNDPLTVRSFAKRGTWLDIYLDRGYVVTVPLADIVQLITQH
ncbi:hypothetical protein [Streptomyces sp. NEAU-H3]|uniref:hypothetical protein n=1 Tax=Streptomyces sp. NEAU-H3 TaxID=2720636 RepID=UPI001439183C|nr:hypothetical protein [Streptomyces sp. NEAU-H3]NJA56660.1 hypothetical protein [Streptomyces sp. NEAU-H3]